MRGIPSLITDIRKQVFAEVARMAYSGDYTDMEDIPFKIVPGQSPLHRESVFLERAIAGERVRLAMGLSLQPVQTRTLLTEGMDQAAIAEQYYEPPLVNIIPYACHACPTKQYRVTELCQGCLAASCQRVCPKGAVKFVNGKSRIDQKLCIKCGKCARSCPYNAITYLERPCQAACGMDAIESDELEFYQNNKINVLSAADVDHLGVPAALERMVSHMKRFSKVYITLDIDCLDPAYAAGTGTPQFGGLTARQLLDLLKGLFDGLNIIGMDVVEVAPRLDPSLAALFAARKIITECWAHHYFKNLARA